MGMHAFFYKLSILDLFNCILKETHEKYTSINQFINFVLKNLFRNLKTYPLLYLQLLYPKSRRDCVRIKEGDVGEDQEAANGLNSTSEIQVKRGVNWRDQIGIIITVLNENGDRELIDWLIVIMKGVIGLRSNSDDHEDYGIFY